MKATPCAFRKFAVIKMYPWKPPVVIPASGSNWLVLTARIEPAMRLPFESRLLTLLVALVWTLKGVPAPVAVLGKKSNLSVPFVGMAPPVGNASRVVFAISIPVSIAPATSAYGINIVVLEGTILTTVTGAVSVSVNLG